MNTTILTKSPLFRTNKCLLTYFIIYLLSAAKFRPGKIPVMYTDLSDSNVESTMTFINKLETASYNRCPVRRPCPEAVNFDAITYCHSLHPTPL